MDLRLRAFERLLNIMDELREKCPWDKKQTFESLRNLTIEETYELADAISENNLEELNFAIYHGVIIFVWSYVTKIDKIDGYTLI